MNKIVLFRMIMKTRLGFHIQKTVYMMIVVDKDSYLNNEIFKLVTLKFRIMHLVHQNHLDQQIGINVFLIAHIQV